MQGWNETCGITLNMLLYIFEPTCASCTVGSYASLSVCACRLWNIFILNRRKLFHSDIFLFVHAFHVCESKGGLYVNVKLYFSKKKAPPKKNEHGYKLWSSGPLVKLILFYKWPQCFDFQVRISEGMMSFFLWLLFSLGMEP